MVLIQISLIMDLTFQFLSCGSVGTDFHYNFWITALCLNGILQLAVIEMLFSELLKRWRIPCWISIVAKFSSRVCSVYIWRELLLIVDQDYINPGKALIISSGPDRDWVIPGPQDLTNQKASIGGLQISTAYQFSSIHPFILWRPNLTLL